MDKKYEHNWFRHIKDSFNDPKHQALDIKYQHIGYGIYWKIIEQLYKSDDSSISIKLLKMTYPFDIIEYMIELELFYVVNDKLMNKIVDEQKDDMNIKKIFSIERARKGGIAKSLKNKEKNNQ